MSTETNFVGGFILPTPESTCEKDALLAQLWAEDEDSKL